MRRETSFGKKLIKVKEKEDKKKKIRLKVKKSESTLLESKKINTSYLQITYIYIYKKGYLYKKPSQEDFLSSRTDSGTYASTCSLTRATADSVSASRPMTLTKLPSGSIR